MTSLVVEHFDPPSSTRDTRAFGAAHRLGQRIDQMMVGGTRMALAEVVRTDRGEAVGGTLHPKPTVAAR